MRYPPDDLTTRQSNTTRMDTRCRNCEEPMKIHLRDRRNRHICGQPRTSRHNPPRSRSRQPCPLCARREEDSGSHGLSRSAGRQGRRSANPQVAIGQRHRLPELIVRIRFPLPACKVIMKTADAAEGATWSAAVRQREDERTLRPRWDLHTSADLVCYFKAFSSSRQALSQRREACSQTRQCS
jgi:hypothetical protein